MKLNLRKKNRIAVFIDSDNVNHSVVEASWGEIETLGNICIAKAYGNWKSSNLQKMNQVISSLPITKVQQDSYMSKKNATDIAMSIDAIDLFHLVGYDIAIIVSGDSDFTPLVEMLKKKNVFAVGVGPVNSSSSFINACDEHFFMDDIAEANAESENSLTETKNDERSPAVINVCRKQKKEHFLMLVEKLSAQEEEKTGKETNDFFLANLPGKLKLIDPDFSISQYEKTKLTDLIRMFPDKLRLYKDGTSNLVRLLKKPEKDFGILLKEVIDGLDSKFWFNGVIQDVEAFQRFIIKNHAQSFKSTDYGEEKIIDLLKMHPDKITLVDVDRVKGPYIIINGFVDNVSEKHNYERGIIIDVLNSLLNDKKQSFQMDYVDFSKQLRKRHPLFKLNEHGHRDLKDFLKKHRNIVKFAKLTGEGKLYVMGNSKITIYEHLNGIIEKAIKGALEKGYECPSSSEARLINSFSINLIEHERESFYVSNFLGLAQVFSGKLMPRSQNAA